MAELCIHCQRGNAGADRSLPPPLQAFTTTAVSLYQDSPSSYVSAATKRAANRPIGGPTVAFVAQVLLAGAPR
jgi:hypothetical protein